MYSLCPISSESQTMGSQQTIRKLPEITLVVFVLTSKLLYLRVCCEAGEQVLNERSEFRNLTLQHLRPLKKLASEYIVSSVRYTFSFQQEVNFLWKTPFSRILQQVRRVIFQTLERRVQSLLLLYVSASPVCRTKDRF